MDKIRNDLRRASEVYDHLGATGVVRAGLNKALLRGARVSAVHLMALDPTDVREPSVDSSFQRRFLTPDEVRRYAEDPRNGLSPHFADRVDGGFDMCFGAVHGDRLANYGWYAFTAVEPEHAAGVSLGLPTNVAYVYKAFTHPDFRGRRLNGACVAEAASVLSTQGVDLILAMIYWSNEGSLRSFKRLGFRRLGLLVVGPGGPLRIPPTASRLGVSFDTDAERAIELRRSGAAASASPTAW